MLSPHDDWIFPAWVSDNQLVLIGKGAPVIVLDLVFVPPMH